LEVHPSGGTYEVRDKGDEGDARQSFCPGTEWTEETREMSEGDKRNEKNKGDE
jgi:hypothetical protein